MSPFVKLLFTILFILVGASMLGLVQATNQAGQDEVRCRAKGGYTVRLREGYVCAKLEILK